MPRPATAGPMSRLNPAWRIIRPAITTTKNRMDVDAERLDGIRPLLQLDAGEFPVPPLQVLPVQEARAIAGNETWARPDHDRRHDHDWPEPRPRRPGRCKLELLPVPRQRQDRIELGRHADSVARPAVLRTNAARTRGRPLGRGTEGPRRVNYAVAGPPGGLGLRVKALLRRCGR